MKQLILTSFVITVLLAWTHQTGGCSCVPSHPHKQFCDAEFALIGRVVHVKEIAFPGSTAIKTRRYTVRVRRVFKGSCKRHRKIHIETAGNSAACGVIIPKGAVWLLTGSVSNKKYRIGLCGWNAPWHSIPWSQKRMLLRGFYKKHCACGKTIVRCSRGSCPPGTPIHGCRWFAGSQRGICQAKYAFCGKRGKGCHWRKRSGFGKCIKPKIIKYGKRI